MKISELIKEKGQTLSFEIFPPKGDAPVEVIYKTLAGLSRLAPDFISVTYGAGGSNKGRALEIAGIIKHTYGIEPLAHLTCVGADKKAMQDQIKEMKEAGISNILALRGDVPEGMDKKSAFSVYPHASDLIEEIKTCAPECCIAAAAYPEIHSESDRLADDLRYLATKAQKGASFFVTQLFFDNLAYFRLVELLAAMGVEVPIVAGIMPVLNPSQILRMATLCGCSIPAAVSRMIAKYSGSPEDFKKAGIEYAAKQIDELWRMGASVHLYSMNKPEEIAEIVKLCGLR